MEVHQILPTLSVGDAIGNEVLKIRELLVKWGYSSEIYAENIHPKIASKARNYKSYKDSPNNVLIFHYSIGSDITNFVASLKSKIVLRYHGVTPNNFFKGYNEQLRYLCMKGNVDLEPLAGIAYLTLPNSEYSKLELESKGFKNNLVMPLMIDFNKYDIPCDNVLNQYNDSFKNILFVGRILPQKRQEDVIKTFYYYKKYINHESRLYLVGNNSFEGYYQYLQALTNKLDLKDVYFTGMVDFKTLISYYKHSDLFVCMSEWESFCAPLLESMYFQLPILAYNCSVIPYTLGNAGVLINKKNYREIAELSNIIIEDGAIREPIIQKQNERLEAFSEKNVSQILKQAIESILD
jgi:glycosyltransferase involved in cell wall biosynthesis